MSQIAPNRSFRGSIAVTAVAALLCLLSTAGRAETALPTDEGAEEVLDEAWRVVGRHFYDASFSGLDWTEVGRRYRALARETSGGRPVHDLINRMLGELRASHMVLIESELYRNHVRTEHDDRKAILIGLELVLLEESYFVISVLQGGPAERAGIRRGDRIVSVNETPLERSDRLLPAGSDPGLSVPHLFRISAGRGAPVRLGIRRSNNSSTVEVREVLPERTNQIEAMRKSVRVLEREGIRIGMIHLRHLMSPRVARILEEAMEDEWRDLDGLVVDLRGRGGSAGVAKRILKVLGDLDLPVVGVIDEMTRSAKEIVAYRLRKDGIGTLVGERTQGAVLAGNFHRLSDGSVLLIAVEDVSRLTDGVTLEGLGVEPDVWIEDRIAYAGGEDRILERAIEVVVARTRGLPTRSRRFY
ncbi:MAG: S41 family peptidase [Planctomycetota bacterium]|nr:S41 family peptidase [Planctomycetota bacterium]